MNTKRKAVIVVGVSVVLLLLTAAVAIHAQQSAAVQMAQPNADIAGGKELALTVTLDKPAPPNMSIIARIRPDSGQQVIQLQSSVPDDASRTKFTLKTSLPVLILPGKWTLENVWVTLPDSVNWQNLAHNQLTFDVHGKAFEIPSKADVALGH